MPPSLDFASCVVQPQYQCGIEALPAQAPVETLHIDVVGRLARAAEVKLDAPLVGPLVHHFGDELAAVV